MLGRKQSRFYKHLKVFLIITILVVIATLYKIECHATNIQGLNENEKKKVIYVIYDNSSSMVKDAGDKNDDDKYTTRWVEASYAIQALATMMNPKDSMRIYPISGSAPGKEFTMEQNSLQGVLDEIEKQVSYIEGDTFFTSVENAVKDIQERRSTDCDYWIVILTDGDFNDLEKKGEKLQDKLVEIHSNNSRVPFSIAYIYIAAENDQGKDKDNVKIEGNDLFLYVPDDTSDSITAQITNIANKIYKRVAIDQSDGFFNFEGDNASIKLNIPLEKVLIFTQYINNNYEMYQNIEDNVANEYDKLGIVSVPKESEGFVNSNTYTITGTSRKISFAPRVQNNLRLDKIKYRYVIGNMYVFKSTGTYENFQNQSITVNNPAMDGFESNINVYYTPAVTVGVSYYDQDGEPISHTEECESRTDLTEACIAEGTVKLHVDIFSNSESRELLDSDRYRLLYPDKFKVSLYREGSNVNLIEEDRREDLQFICELEKGTYELRIVTSWNEVFTQTLEVQDRWQPVAMEFYDTDAVFFESAENPSCDVKIRAYSGGDATDEEVLQHLIDINLDSGDNEYFTVEKLGELDTGIWKFRVTLIDPSEHDVGEELMLYATAETDYRMSSSNIHSFQASLPIDSADFEVTSSLQAEAQHYIWRLLFGETVGINYYLDGIELTESQRENVRVIGNWETEPQDMWDKIKITDEGDIRIKPKPWFWFFNKSDTVTVKWNVAYTRWNHEESQEVVVELKIQSLPVMIQCSIVGVVILLVIYAVLMILKHRSEIFIPRYKVTLESEYDSPQKIKFHRKGMAWLPFWNTVVISYRDNGGFFPNILVKIRNNPEGDGFEILNYGMLSDEKTYKLGKKGITGNNNIISETRLFKVSDSNECWHKLVMKR